MPRCKAILLLTWLGVLMLALALMELLSLQNELFRMLFYWTYLACVPGIALLALSMLGKEVPPWRMLFMPAALICFIRRIRP